MTYKVGPKGQVVIPKEIRDALGIRPGDEVIVERSGEAVRVRRARDAAELLGLLAHLPVTSDDLLAARRAEREREESKIQRMPR
jgi:AbrB family looped-hinge helix DNA binding protein